MTSKRLIALDVMRGLTIALMIMVNTPGSWSYVYAPLLHSKWNGCTPTDLVFPFFLFIVGTSMWYSFKKFESGITKKALYKILKRFSIMFLLGVFLNAFPHFDFENLRYLGVLQRIAIAYLFGALFCMQFNFKTLVAIFIFILLGYWGILYFGGSAEVYALPTNAVLKVDTFIFGKNHLYKGFGIPFDPEGLISALPSIATLLMGYFTGEIIDTSKNTLSATRKMILFGTSSTVIALIWSLILPINKALWTSSYVLFTGGLALLFLALLLWIIDIKGIKKWATPTLHFGTNPLFIYVFSELYTLVIVYLIQFNNASGVKITGYDFLYEKVFVPIAGNMNGSLLFAITHIIFFWFLTYILYRKKIFIKI